MMIRKRYDTMINVLNTMSRTLVHYSIILILLQIIGQSQYSLPSSCVLIIPFLSYYMEEKSKHILSYFVSHILIACLYYYIADNNTLKILYVSYTLLLMVYHFYRRLKKDSIPLENISLLWPGILIIIYLYAYWKNYDLLTNRLQVIALMFTIIYLINMYLLNFTDFMNNERIQEHVNIGQVKRMNHTLIIILITTISILVASSYMIPSHYILTTLLSIVLYLLRVFFSFFRNKNTEDGAQDIEPSNTPVADFSSLGEPSKANPIWLIIQELVLALFYVAIVVGIIALLVYVIYQVYKQFHQRREDSVDKKEFISPFYKKDSIPRNNRQGKIPVHIFANNNEKIRRYFYREVKKKYKDKVPYYRTADELLRLSNEESHKLLTEENLDFDPNFIRLYHKARYSNELCSKEEVNQVRKLIKKIDK